MGNKCWGYYNISFSENASNKVGAFTVKNKDQDIYNSMLVKQNQFKLILNSSNIKNIITQNFFSNNMIIEDVWRYNIKIGKNIYPVVKQNNNKDSKFTNSKYNDKEIKIDDKDNSIVLILESPHKDEYKIKNGKYIPIAPAQGDTGIGIDKNISIIINEFIENPKYNCSLSKGEYKFIICNPVQYQTSLYYFHKSDSSKFKTLRNNIWKSIFEQNSIKDDFLNRIDSYKPKLIINACTDKLKCKVKEVIKSNFSVDYIETYHPSYWNGYDIKAN